MESIEFKSGQVIRTCRSVVAGPRLDSLGIKQVLLDNRRDGTGVVQIHLTGVDIPVGYWVVSHAEDARAVYHETELHELTRDERVEHVIEVIKSRVSYLKVSMDTKLADRHRTLLTWGPVIEVVNAARKVWPHCVGELLFGWDNAYPTVVIGGKVIELRLTGKERYAKIMCGGDTISANDEASYLELAMINLIAAAVFNATATTPAV